LALKAEQNVRRDGFAFSRRIPAIFLLLIIMPHARTPLLQVLQKAFHKALRSLRDEKFFKHPGKDVVGYDRRRFLLSAAKAVVTVGAADILSRASAGAAPVSLAPTIAVIGGGLAGLSAAYYLRRAGHHALVYEADGSTLGGRVKTVRNILGQNLTTEAGGEFIDSGHVDLLRLAGEFRLELIDTQLRSEKRLVKDDYFFGGKRYTERDVIEEFRGLAKLIKRDQDSLPKSLDYKTSTPLGRQLDLLSAEEYFTHIGARGWFFDLLKNAFTSEFGMDIGEQSSLNFITMIGADVSQDKFKIFGESDERYKIKGGNDLIIRALASRLSNQIKTGYNLAAIKTNGRGFVLSFENGKETKADYLILALPFTMLRHVELKVELPPQKRRAINELGYGSNAKLLLGFRERVWRSQGFSGYLFNDEIQNGWDNSQLQNNNLGVGGYTVFLGGARGKSLQESDHEKYLLNLDHIYRGAAHQFNEQQRVFNWSSNPLTRGSYACYKPGQWTSIGGAEFEPVGQMYFAGEHCSRDFQGYMNGAAETGRRSAQLLSHHLRRQRVKRRAR
jgi:monoamine oxidase